MSSRITTAAGKPATSAVKKTSGKSAATKTPAQRPATRTPRSGEKKRGFIAPEDRIRFIAEAAYFKAEQRGFVDGGELGDWIEAEAEINALLNSRGAG
ncbi:MAG: hypothetical protein BroJett006_25150 [Betaproteobacteria bacterium]|nr:MAG: hypothetical protein BroJett006_25150 [Betaproteobacteria bacterium]